MMTWMNLLCFLAGSLPLAALLYLQQKNHLESEQRWMRIFSVASLQIPKGTMEGSEEKPPAMKKPDTRQRMHIPLPISDYAKDVYRSLKKEKNA
jgi:hypothetical protein